jgi:hypothetical protein
MMHNITIYNAGCTVQPIGKRTGTVRPAFLLPPVLDENECHRLLDAEVTQSVPS